MITTCTYHCAVCNSHFHSEDAFVAHRPRGTCEEPADDPRFVALATDGKCELQRVPYTPHEPGNRQVYPAGWKAGDPPMQRVVRPAVVWTLARSMNRERGDLQGRPSPQTAVGGQT